MSPPRPGARSGVSRCTKRAPPRCAGRASSARTRRFRSSSARRRAAGPESARAAVSSRPRTPSCHTRRPASKCEVRAVRFRTPCPPRPTTRWLWPPAPTGAGSGSATAASPGSRQANAAARGEEPRAREAPRTSPSQPSARLSRIRPVRRMYTSSSVVAPSAYSSAAPPSTSGCAQPIPSAAALSGTTATSVWLLRT